MLFKPYGFLSQFVPETRKKKPLLGELHSFPPGAMAIGRLDHDSEGLLLVTTDGMISHQVRSKKIDKEYYVQLDGEITDEALTRLRQGVTIGIKGTQYQTLPCRVFKLDNPPSLPARGRAIRHERHGVSSWVSITINEGKYRQVRKMTAAVGFPTLRLIRVRIGKINLEQLKAAQANQELLPGSVAQLQSVDV